MKAYRIFIALSVLAMFSSCTQDLLDPPSFNKRGSYSTGEIAAPENVNATQGLYREIQLSWPSSKGAKQYFIYASDSSTGEFKKIAETSDDSNSYSYKEEPGILKYFRVSAVDSYGNESARSGLCHGSTLAAPVITKISKDTGGNEVTVRWYGGSNCTESTYLNSLCFEVVLFDSAGETVIREESVEGTERSFTFGGLSANTQYYFLVKAYIKSQQDDAHTEMSDKVNEATAHRVIPDAPKELSAAKGISRDGVVLSWKVPVSVDVKSGGDYVPHPVYFKVLRKELSASDEAYEPIVSYIGVVKGNESYKDSGTLSADEYRINCDSETVAAADGVDVSVITVKKGGDENSQANAYYPEYIPGTEIMFTDTTAQIGKQYSYRVQSYTDGNGAKTVTSDESYAGDSGWKIATPRLKTSAEYLDSNGEEINEETTEIASVNVSFEAEFEDFGIPYKYVLYETCDKRNNSDGEEASGNDTTPKEKCRCDSVDDITAFTRTYQTDDDYFYYYTYELKILSVDETEEYDSVKAPGVLLVVKDKNKQPVIEDFSVKDGYTGYFVISWKYDEKCAYTISWDNTDKNGAVTQDSIDLAVTEDMLETVSDEEGNEKQIVVYKHTAENGDSRTYTLTASNGLKDAKTYPEVHTLKIPEPKMKDISYDKIEVTWDADEMSDGNYTVTAYYKDRTQNLAVTDGENPNTEITSGGTTVTCVIDKPDGYDRAAQSGSPIQFTVSTKSTTYDENDTDEVKDDKTATASVSVCTLGPAAANTRISDSDEKSVEVKWNEVQGAAGYKIFRTRYVVSESGWIPDTVDAYYTLAGTDDSLTVLDGTIKGTTCTSTSGEYTLRDVYREPDSGEENNQYAISQSRLAWGIPYSYTVIPVLSEDDFIGDIDANTNTFVLGDDSKVMYTDIADFANDVKGAAYGYGLNLVAAKAESGDRQNMNWVKPYQPLIPVVYRRVPATGSEDKGEFSKVESVEEGKNTASVSIEAADRYSAFEYVIKYYPAKKNGIDISPAAKITIQPSLLEELKKQNQDYSTPQGSKTELNNKGYLLTLKDFYARICEDKPYYEQIGWTDWDYDERAVGPDSIIISVQNNNIDAGWHPFIGVTGAYANTNGSPAKLSDGITDVIIEPNQTNRIYIAPQGIANGTKGTTDGMLKVLRDYKHNYTFKLKRIINGSETTVDCNDGVKTAYREITDEELVKATMLILADIEHDSDSQSHTTGGAFSLKGASGSFSGKGSTSSYMTWHLDQYQHNWKSLPSGDKNIPAFLTLNDESGTKGRKFSKYFVHLSTDWGSSFKIDKPISITVSSTIYGSKIITVASSADKFKATVDSSAPYTADGLENCRYWMPMEWYKSGLAGTQSSYGYFGKSTTYGWWPKSN